MYKICHVFGKFYRVFFLLSCPIEVDWLKYTSVDSMELIGVWWNSVLKTRYASAWGGLFLLFCSFKLEQSICTPSDNDYTYQWRLFYNSQGPFHKYTIKITIKLLPHTFTHIFSGQLNCDQWSIPSSDHLKSRGQISHDNKISFILKITGGNQLNIKRMRSL